MLLFLKALAFTQIV